MSSFSYDILHNMLLRLPVENLLRLRVVCKLWKRVIDDPFFVKSHTSRSQQSCAESILILNRYGLFSLSLDRLQHTITIGTNTNTIPMMQLCQREAVDLRLPAPSCNGLILISHKNVDTAWAIWNPFFQDNFHEIPPAGAIDRTRAIWNPYLQDFQESTPAPAGLTILDSLGFGYDESSDDYKVVRIDTMYQGRFMYHGSLIYSVKSRRWRAMQGFPGSDCEGRGVFLNGSLHWTSEHGIIALHLGREDHHLVAAPSPYPPLVWKRLYALDGCLILSHQNQEDMAVWVMKDYENKVWTKLFSLSDQTSPEVVGYFKSKGQVLLQHRDIELILIDLENKCSRKITIFGFPCTSWPSFGPFCPGSLVRLDSTKSRRAVGKRNRKRKRRNKYEVYATVGEKIQ